jgi:hypothetical protein
MGAVAATVDCVPHAALAHAENSDEISELAQDLLGKPVAVPVTWSVSGVVDEDHLLPD